MSARHEKYTKPRKCPACLHEPFYAYTKGEWWDHNRTKHKPIGFREGRVTGRGKINTRKRKI